MSDADEYGGEALRSGLRGDPLVNSDIRAAESRGDEQAADEIRALARDPEVIR